MTVVENLMTKGTGAANYAVSRQGTLYYVSDGVSVQMTPKSLVWVDRNGREEPVNAPPRAYGPPRISPDGTQLAFNIVDQQGADISIWNLARGTMRGLTFAPGFEGVPIWSPDGQRIIFTATRAGVPNIYSQRADGTGTAERWTTSANPQYPTSIGPAGTVLGFERVPIPKAESALRIRLYRPASRTASAPTAATPALIDPSGETLFDGTFPEFSPDGRYIAYQSPGNRTDVYVRPFPQVDSGLWKISTSGGTRPVWSRSGRELFYLDASNTLTAVRVDTSGIVFQCRPAGEGVRRQVCDALSPSPLRRVPGRQAVPDAQRQRQRSERDAGQHGCRRTLVRGTEAPGADQVGAAFVVMSRFPPAAESDPMAPNYIPDNHLQSALVELGDWNRGRRVSLDRSLSNATTWLYLALGPKVRP